LRSNAKSVPPGRRAVLSAVSTRFEKEVVDAALTAAVRRGELEQSDDDFERDETGAAGFSLDKANDQFFAQLGASLVHAKVKSTTSLSN
jgi:hypothetical protein